MTESDADQIDEPQPPDAPPVERDDPLPWVAAPAKPRPRHADLRGLRILIVAWCCWLLGAWAVTVWIISESTVPATRWILYAGLLGLMLIWPAFRLSERIAPGRLGRGALQALLDWLVMTSVFQAVILALYFGSKWPVVRGVWLDAAVLAWSLLSALIVAAARLWPGAPARIVGMLLCIALVFAEPLAVWVTLVNGGDGWPMRVSPVQAVWELTDPTGQTPIHPWDKRVLMIAVVAVMGWAALGLWAFAERRRRRSAEKSAGPPKDEQPLPHREAPEA